MRDEQQRVQPLGVLRDLSRTQKTGELICALDASEVHVYLQAGRVAWGTDTDHPFAFARRVMEVCRIDRARFVELVAACRRENIALGEGLVKRGLASREQTRNALRHQASLAARALLHAQTARCAFFERKGFASYDSSLTFALEELLTEEALATPRASLTPPNTSAPERGTRTAQRAFQEVAGCEWAEHWNGTTLVEQHPMKAGEPRVPAGLLSLLHNELVDLVAVRNGAGALLGTTLHVSSESAWCGVREDAPFGAAYAAFSQVSGADRKSKAARSNRRTSAQIVQEERTELGFKALAMMERVPDVLGVCHLAGSQTSSVVVRTGEEHYVVPERLSGFAQRSFAPEVLAACPIGGSAGYGLRTAVLGDVDLWAYGMELSAITNESLWLVTNREVAQGFGWACLAALVRELGVL